jgi:hypothetical protein
MCTVYASEICVEIALFEELNLYSMSVLRCPSFGSTMCQILDRDLRAYILRVQMFVCNTHFDDWYQAVLYWIELAFLMIYHVGIYPRQGLDRVDFFRKNNIVVVN